MDQPGSQSPMDANLVRGADGRLYLLTKNNAPLELPAGLQCAVDEFVTDTERKLSELVSQNPPSPLGGTQHIHVLFPDVVPE